MVLNAAQSPLTLLARDDDALPVRRGLDRVARGLRVLVVDGDANVAALARDALDRPEVHAVDSLAAASDLLAQLHQSGRQVDLVLIDRALAEANNLADKDLRRVLAQHHPAARRVVLCDRPSLDAGLDALRRGALDYLTKPLDADTLRQRLAQAAGHRHLAVHTQRRLNRLKNAVRGLNLARRTIGRQVDLLCNDLVSAYGEVSKQVEQVRVGDELRRLLDSAGDLEQLLCHAMDWILRRLGNCNIALLLFDEDGDSELGAYMKYTVAGDEPLTDWLALHLPPLLDDEKKVAAGRFDKLLAGEMSGLDDEHAAALDGQSLIVADATYMGESLATLAVFRAADKPFADDAADSLRLAATTFALALARLVRDDDGEDGNDCADKLFNRGLGGLDDLDGLGDLLG